MFIVPTDFDGALKRITELEMALRIAINLLQPKLAEMPQESLERSILTSLASTLSNQSTTAKGMAVSVPRGDS